VPEITEAKHSGFPKVIARALGWWKIMASPLPPSSCKAKIRPMV